MDDVDGVDLVATPCDGRSLPIDHNESQHFNLIPGYGSDILIHSGEQIDVQMLGMMDADGKEVIAGGTIVCTFAEEEDVGPNLDGGVSQIVLHSGVTEIVTPEGLKILLRPVHVAPPSYVAKWRVNNDKVGETIFTPLQPESTV